MSHAKAASLLTSRGVSATPGVRGCSVRAAHPKPKPKPSYKASRCHGVEERRFKPQNGSCLIDCNQGSSERLRGSSSHPDSSESSSVSWSLSPSDSTSWGSPKKVCVLGEAAFSLRKTATFPC
jgi:hypothetical protein